MAGKKQMKQATKVDRAVLRNMLKQHDRAVRELKYQTTTNSGTLSTTGNAIEITQNLSQGDNVNNRSGDQVSCEWLDVWWQASMNSAANNERMRVIIFVDKLNLGSSPALTDVLDTASVISGYNTYSVQAKRHKILHDQTYVMSINGGNRGINGQMRINLKGLKVTFTTTTASWGKNCIKVYLLDDLGANNGTYAFGYGLAFYDS